MNWYIGVLKNYTGFDGRARRMEYWWFTLINVIIAIVLSVIGVVTHIGPWLNLVYSLAVLLPSLAVCIRRLHDTNRSGWWLLIGLVPFVGAIDLLFSCSWTVSPATISTGRTPKGLRRSCTSKLLKRAG
jgi:uncharacterized membrane protein YhaH (DUF805 family)